MQFYVPHAENGGGSMTVLVRSTRSPDDIARAIRSTVSLTDPEQAVRVQRIRNVYLSHRADTAAGGRK